MAYLAKDQVDATVNGVYGSYGGDGADPVVDIKPAETVASPEELKAQSLYADRLEAEADALTEVGIARAHRDRAGKARNSMPYLEYQARCKKIRDAQRDAGVISGAEAIEIRGSYATSLEELRASQLYNPVMQFILEAKDHGAGLTTPESYLPVNPDAADLAGCAAARVILGLDAVRAAVKPSALPSAERITEMASCRPGGLSDGQFR